MREASDVTPRDAGEVTDWDEHGRRGGGGLRRRRHPRPSARPKRGPTCWCSSAPVARRRGGAGRRHRLPGRGHAHPAGLRLPRHPPGHVRLHDGRLRPRPRRGEDRPLLRREPGPLRLAGGPGRALRPELLCRDVHGPPGEEGLVYSGGEDAYPFDQMAPPGPPGPPGQDEAGHRVAADAAPGGAPPRRVRGLARHGATGWCSTTGRVVGVQASGSARRCRCEPAAAWC